MSPVGPALPPKLAVQQLNAHLRHIQKETEKELSSELRRVGNEARDEVRGSSEDPYLTGGSRKSIKTSVRRKFNVSLYSNEPQVPVLEWEGTIRPKGVPIEFKGTAFVRPTVLERGDDIDDKLADAFDSIARRNGFF